MMVIKKWSNLHFTLMKEWNGHSLQASTISVFLIKLASNKINRISIKDLCYFILFPPSKWIVKSIQYTTFTAIDPKHIQCFAATSSTFSRFPQFSILGSYKPPPQERNKSINEWVCLLFTGQLTELFSIYNNYFGCIKVPNNFSLCWLYFSSCSSSFFKSFWFFCSQDKQNYYIK